MKRVPIFSLLATLILVPYGIAQSAAPATATLLRAGRLLDPRTGVVTSPVAVLIENGKIKDAGSPAKVQAGAPAGVGTIEMVPRLQQAGVSEAMLHKILVENPRRLLAFVPKTA